MAAASSPSPSAPSSPRSPSSAQAATPTLTIRRNPEGTFIKPRVTAEPAIVASVGAVFLD